MRQEITNFTIAPQSIGLGESVTIECDVAVDGMAGGLLTVYLRDATRGTGDWNLIELGKTEINGHLKATWQPTENNVGTYEYTLKLPEIEWQPGVFLDAVYSVSVPLSVAEIGAEVIPDLAWVSGKLS